MAKFEVKTVCVLSERLKEKKENVTEQLRQAEKFVIKLCSQRDALIARQDEECSSVEDKIASLERLLGEKKIGIIEELKARRREELDRVSASVKLANEAISKSNKVISEAGDLEKEKDSSTFVSAYTAINNSLEQMFIDLLLLMDGCTTNIKDEQKATIDVSGVVEALEVVAIKESEAEESEAPGLPSSNSLETVARSDLADDDVSVTSGGAVSLEQLELSPQTSTDVYVTEVCGPHRFTVQPSGEELIALMKDMGRYYSKESCEKFHYMPEVGDFCCAQFTEDDCWYRAKVIEVINSEDMQVLAVNYVDYGNEEQLPFVRLRPLDPKFCVLPCQAIHCSLGSCSKQPSDPWYEKIFDWFSSLLLGKTVTIVTTEGVGSPSTTEDVGSPSATEDVGSPSATEDVGSPSATEDVGSPSATEDVGSPSATEDVGSPSATEDVGSPSAVPVEVLVPWEKLRKSACLNLFLPKEVSDKDFVHLSAFMDLSCNFSALDERIGEDFIHISHLPPLLVKLNSCGEFTCLMSHVTDDLRCYVHPVQENLAHDMTFISDELCATGRSHDQLSSEHVRCGSVCCVFSKDFQHWCRVVVVCLKKEQGEEKTECLVFYLDYGGLEWIEPSKLFRLPKLLQKLPSQVVCCNFDELTANSSRSGADLTEKRLLTNPDLEGFESRNNYVCSIVQQELASKGVQFITSATKEKQLFVMVKETGFDYEDVLLVHQVNCVLPVDLYDTTGEVDFHVNQEVVKAITQVSNQKSQDHVVDLHDWNPMEEDYLSKRNIYKIDDEDTGLALDGYKSTSRICHYYAAGKQCYRGDRCPFMHLQEGLSNKQEEKAVVEMSEGFVRMPRQGDWVVAIVTAIISATRFYVQLPLGRTSPLCLDHEEEPIGSEAEQDFPLLLEEMREFYNQQVFNERDVILPHTGEIVAVHYVEDDYWYRARVIDSVDNTLHVFFVDYGNMASVLDIHVRNLKPEYLILPFHAYECFLPDLHHSPGYVSRQHHARECLTDYVQDKVLVARVLSVEASGSLGVELYCNDDDVDESINRALVERNILRVETMHRNVSQPSAKCTIMRPG